MGLLSKAWRCCQLALAAALLALGLIAWGICQEPAPQRLPVDAATCASSPPAASLKPVHLRKAEFDIVLYGATGFTGKLVARYLANAPGNFKFAIAGRDWAKLDRMDTELTAFVKDAGHGRDAAAILVADSKDPVGLRKMVRKARVVLTTAGPYLKYGTNLLEICAEEGTHYADITGEYHWMRRMIEANAAKAQFSGAKIVQAAGFVTLPFELGTALALRELDRALGGPAANVTVTAATTGMRGAASGGTIASGRAMQELEASGKVPVEWTQDPYVLVPNAPCKVDASADGWGKPRYDSGLGLFGFPSPIGGRMVRRALELLGRRSVSYREGFSLGGVADMAFFNLLWGGQIDKNPPVGEGPTVSVQYAGGYSVAFAARDEDSGRVARVNVKGRGDGGYLHTAGLLAEVGLCLLEPSCHREGSAGGIHTSVSACKIEALVKRLYEGRHPRDSSNRPLLTVELLGVSKGPTSEL